MSDGPRHSIFCVACTSESVRTLESMLHGHVCSFYTDVVAAMRRFYEHPSDAYVLDCWMPDWSGPLLCREIRKHDPHCPIVFCGTASTAQRDDAIRAGASTCVEAPLAASALTLKIDWLLRLSDIDCARARDEAQRTLDVEMKRAARGEGLASSESVERAARLRTFRTFIDCGGTRAHFERWWPEMFENAGALLA